MLNTNESNSNGVRNRKKPGCLLKAHHRNKEKTYDTFALPSGTPSANEDKPMEDHRRGDSTGLFSHSCDPAKGLRLGGKRGLAHLGLT